MKPLYLGSFHSKKDVMAEFEESKETFKAVKIILAAHAAYGYSERAFVLFKNGNKLFEVNASHCSCYGFEEQWRPEETSVKALRFRLHNGSFSDDFDASDMRFRDTLTKVLDSLEGVGTDSPMIMSFSRDCCEVCILYKGIRYKYLVKNWGVVERILRKPLFTFKDWNLLKKNSELLKST